MQRVAIVMLMICMCFSCARDPVSPDGTTEGQQGKIECNLIFDESPAKSSVYTGGNTVAAALVIYDRTGSIAVYRSMTIFNNHVIESFSVLAGAGYSVKLVGFDNTCNITYQGITHNIKVLPGTTSKVDLHMKSMGFVEIPGGTFTMGSDTGEDDELPVHTVTIKPFLMHSTEVTQFQIIRLFKYYQVLDSNDVFLEGFSDDVTHPAHNIRWTTCIKMCNEMSIMDGYEPCYNKNPSAIEWICDFSKNGYRLPTEAEWEYACRAQSDTDFSSGNSIEDLERLGWFDENTHEIRGVGLKEPNVWGLYDMHGNAWEWCWDFYKAGYYSISPDDNPTGPNSGRVKVIRGGSYESPADICRSASRFSSDKSILFDPIGARLVRTLE